ncbi:alpha/beta hydrolase [Cryobacterium adonitolivorans]|uniref:Alpha/beta hydrolase n=1 Tax=Cryobacterium adonitolivorans TaxID=1259189 RepID=A0A4R8W1X3_9MICO|nr:alpha/beta hydrolase [Cryobacterium adonitolivorans]TFB97454.1 alpha/beta hydrolase [Cryobacterium adonitolivorans]
MSTATDVPAGFDTDLDYCPFGLSKDSGRLGLGTSVIDTALGPITVRHGRRTTTGATGTATILLHGAAGSWTTWTPLISAADRSAAAPLADLIIPDLPGWGDTPLPLDESTETIESLAAAVAEIARALGYRRWRVIGHSLGGFVALELAASTPRQTTYVGLVSATTFSVIDSVRHPVARFAVLPGFTALLGVMRVLSVFGAAGRGLAAGLHRLGLLRALVAPLFSSVRRVDVSVVAALAAEARPRSFALAANRAGHYDADASWARIECPVRSVHGDRDVFVTVDDDRRLAGVVADLEVRVLTGTGHFGHVERPVDTLTALHSAGFLALCRASEES